MWPIPLTDEVYTKCFIRHKARHEGLKGKKMVEFPPYIKLIHGGGVRKSEPVSRSGERRTAPSPAPEKSPGITLGQDVVKLVSKENRRAGDNDVPTALEAEEALRRLESDLPEMGQKVGDLHSGMDRRIILALLAPLVEL